jgi:alpha-L-rhamnosidase
MKYGLVILIAMTVCLMGTAFASDLPAPLAADPELAARAESDPRIRQYIMPCRIVWQSEGDTIEDAEALLNPTSGQASVQHRDGCTLRPGGGVLLDFGRELHGSVQIVVSDLKPTMDGEEPDNGKTARLRVRFGESVSEAMSEQGEKNSQNDHAVRDQTVYAPWLGSVEVGPSGFRFVRIDLEGTPGSDEFVKIKTARAIFIYRDLPYLGSFQCNDERLNEIWDVGAYTVHLNMQDYLWDGIKRDRLVWIGDMHPEAMTICSVFGDTDVVRKSLDLVRDETPLPNWMNGINSYSMWWILIHADWYKHHGDLDYLLEQKPYMTALLRRLAESVAEDGSEALNSGGRFLDWPSNANPEAIHAGLHSLLILTLESGAQMCDSFEDPDTKSVCLDAVTKLRTYTPDPNESKQAAALMALAGLETPEAMNERVMAVDGAQRMSTFYGYYVLEARAAAGDYQGCLDVIREYWGAMIDLGATSFWEDFDLQWAENAAPIDELVPEGKDDIHGDFGNYCYVGFRHSLCHGWASGPTAWMSRHVLGIEIVEPGATVIRVNPHLGDLEWAEGTFPTPHGIIHVRHERQEDGTIESKVDIPEGVRVVE